MINPNDASYVATLTGTIIVLGLVPAFIAFARKHRRRRAILILNLLAGWTVIGWVIAAIWSATSDVESPKALPARIPPKTTKTSTAHKSSGLYHFGPSATANGHGRGDPASSRGRGTRRA